MNLFLIKFHYQDNPENIQSWFVIAPSQSKAVDTFKRYHKQNSDIIHINSIHSLNSLVYGQS